MLQDQAFRGGDRGADICVPMFQGCEIERYCADPGQAYGRDRGGADVTRGFGTDRDAKGGISYRRRDARKRRFLSDAGFYRGRGQT